MSKHTHTHTHTHTQRERERERERERGIKSLPEGRYYVYSPRLFTIHIALKK